MKPYLSFIIPSTKSEIEALPGPSELSFLNCTVVTGVAFDNLIDKSTSQSSLYNQDRVILVLLAPIGLRMNFLFLVSVKTNKWRY